MHCPVQCSALLPTICIWQLPEENLAKTVNVAIKRKMDYFLTIFHIFFKLKQWFFIVVIHFYPQKMFCNLFTHLLEWFSKIRLNWLVTNQTKSDQVDQIGSILFNFVQIGSKKIKMDQVVQIGLNWFKLVQIGSNWFKLD